MDLPREDARVAGVDPRIGILHGLRGAENLRLDPGSRRAEPHRHPAHKNPHPRSRPANRGRLEAPLEGKFHPERGEQILLLHRAQADNGAGDPCAGGVALWKLALWGADGHREHRYRCSVCLCGFIAWSLWYRPRRVGLEFQIPVPRRHPIEFADDFLRACPRVVGDSGVHDLRHAKPAGHRALAEGKRVDGLPMVAEGIRGGNAAQGGFQGGAGDIRGRILAVAHPDLGADAPVVCHFPHRHVR